MRRALALLALLVGCVPAASLPQPAPPGMAEHFFSARCERFEPLPKPHFTPLEGLEADACSSYALVPGVSLTDLSLRVSGTDLAVDGPCTGLPTATVAGLELERLRCDFGATGSQLTEVFIGGDDLRVTPELTTDAGRFYLPPLAPQ